MGVSRVASLIIQTTDDPYRERMLDAIVQLKGSGRQ